MKFYLSILVIFGIFVAGAMNLPSLIKWVRKRDIENTAKDHILARMKDPSAVKWNHKHVAASGQKTLLTYDFTGTTKEGDVMRGIWTFEFDSASKDLLSVKETIVPGLKLGDVDSPKTTAPPVNLE